MTFSVVDRLRKIAQTGTDVNWRAVVAHATGKRFNGLEMLNRIAAKAHPAAKDVEDLADAVDDVMAGHFGAA